MGVKIAPSHKIQAALGLAIIGIGMLGFYIGRFDNNYKEVIFLICFGVGLAAMTFTTFNVHSDSSDVKQLE